MRISKTDNIKIIVSAIVFLFFSNIQAQNLFINEFMASNVTSTPEIVDYDDYSDWIEIYNASKDSVNIGGYYLTDNFGLPTKWQIPENTWIHGKGFLLFWADGYDDIPSESTGIKNFHLNFKLSKDGEEIGLFDANEVLIDSIIYSTQISDVSFGRQPNGTNNWVYFGESTANNNNMVNGTLNTEFTNTPEVATPSGIYNGSQTISITASAEADIRYTLDGSIPLSSSLQYQSLLNVSNINISSTTTLRVRAFENDKLPSKVVTKSYFIDETQNLPILSLTASPNTLFGKEIGIYNNQIKSREVPINAQLFELNGEKAFEVDAGIRLTGQASYIYPQKSLTIETDDKFGEETIDYPVFENRPFENYTSLYLRNSGTQDIRHTMFRDALQHTIVINQMDIDCQAYRPVATYINGDYWGIYNIREKLDNNYFVAHHGIDPNNFDYLEYEFNPDPNIVEGSADEYNLLLEFLSNNDMNNKESWDYVKSQIDVNEVMNYLITEIYSDNVNWPYTNSKWWKEKSENGKWRYIFLDSDYGFGAPSYFSRYTNNTLDFLYHGVQPFSSFVFRKLLENTEFKNEFIQRFATYLNTVFKKERVVNIVDSLQNQISTEMISHIDRWNDGSPPIYNYPPIPDIPTWNMEVGIMREFAEKRPASMKQSILDFYNLSGIENVQFNLSIPDAGIISITGVKIEDGFTGEYFRYVPIKLEATSVVGYKFVKWIGVSDSLSQSTFYSPIRSDSIIQITAVFEEDNINILPSIISSNTTLDISESPFYARGNITVNRGITLTVNSGVEIFMPENASLFVNGNIEMNGTKEEPIIVKPNENSGFTSWGIIYLDSTSAQSVINNVQLIGATNGGYNKNMIGAISGYKSGVIIENTTILDAPFPIFLQYGNAIVRECNLHSEETSDFINIKYATSALIENCEFRGNNSFDTDAIDLDQISNGIVRGNRIYNFYGFNSDGIDLGEGSKNVLIEDNLIFNINDKGISVGQASTTNIKKNIIVSCAQGVGIKDDSSFAFIDRNTFFECDYGVASFEKNIGAGGGNAEIENSIFSKSKISPVFVDAISNLSVDYSLSDTKALDGTDNLHTSALLLNNFILSSTSPSINAGNPATELDADGSRADLGANYFDGNSNPLIINEINYNPTGGDHNEFIEIYNSSNDLIDLVGYKLGGEIDFIFPIGAIIQPKGFILLVNDIPTFSNLSIPVLSWGGTNLPNNGGKISLKNNLDEEIDFVNYSNKFNWPIVADGGGKSLELRNPLDENLVTNNWKASSSFGGSPGIENRLIVSNLLFINEFQADNGSTIKDEFGNYDDWIEIYNASNDTINISGLYITDDFSNLTKHQIVASIDNKNTIAPKEHLILWADGNISQGANHLNFKLGDSGEEIALVNIFATDTTIVDSITFGKQKKDFSFGRENDGEDNWKVIQSPTPGVQNSNTIFFNNGVLLVNGFSFRNNDVIDTYENKALWGSYDIQFWDLFGEISTGYPSTLSEPIGHGAIPIDTLSNYSTVIWTGENNALEMNFWTSSPALEYVKMGGNLILLFKNGRGYISGEMLERLGINWSDPENAAIRTCISVYEGLGNISLKASQNQNSVFDTTLTNNSSLLFTETLSHEEPLGIGVWNKPEYGGWYKENGGQIVFLSGRGFRYDNENLRDNIEYILEYFFEEPKPTSAKDGSGDLMITEYKLNQNFPNPFNPTTVIKYDLVESSNVELKIYNILGQEVRTLVQKFEKKGSKAVVWNGKDNYHNKVSSGIYFYRISANNWNDIKKMILLK